MNKLLILFIFVVSVVTGGRAYAQDSLEVAKLHDFLSQESADSGVYNYQQLGTDNIDDENWRDYPGLTFNSYTGLLESLEWEGKKLSGNLDLSDFKALKSVYCQSNRLNSLNLSGSTALTHLECWDNNLDSLDLTTNNKLNYLCFRFNNLKAIDLSNNPLLTFLCSTKNQLDSLDLSNQTNLETGFCNNNGLKYLNISNCNLLREFSCYGNNLTELNLSNKLFLRTFKCSDNKLSSVKIINCPNFSEFDCKDNVLDSLIIEGCESLTKLDCSNNNLDFHTLPDILPQYTDYVYYPQNKRVMEAPVDSINFKHYFEIDGVFSKFIWNDNTYPVQPLSNSDGIFSFSDIYVDKTLICRIENALFPNLVMRYDVDLKKSNRNNNAGVSDVASFVYGGKGSIHVVAAAKADVAIYSINGAFVGRRIISDGRTDFPIKSGIYIILIDNRKCYKVIVND
ncbi:MAG: DUF6383 domain-containing protein [Tannerella sp.]|nr:DUF6383 domain-containing protein [Tannerella sp.]